VSDQALIDKIRKLPAGKVAEVERFVDSLGQDQPHSGQELPDRSSEHAWRLEGDHLIAHGPDPERLVADAKAKGIAVPYIFFVESATAEVVRIGL
jgi:hypothetical protein